MDEEIPGESSCMPSSCVGSTRGGKAGLGLWWEEIASGFPV